jgi:hypothetical protein
MRTGTIQVTVSRDVKAEQLHKAVDQILHFGGCTTCGLNGIDLRIRVGDPAPDELRKAPGVTGFVFMGQ